MIQENASGPGWPTRLWGPACLLVLAGAAGGGAGAISRGGDPTGERLARVEAQLAELDRKVERLLDRGDR